MAPAKIKLVFRNHPARAWRAYVASALGVHMWRGEIRRGIDAKRAGGVSCEGNQSCGHYFIGALREASIVNPLGHHGDGDVK